LTEPSHPHIPILEKTGKGVPHYPAYQESGRHLEPAWCLLSNPSATLSSLFCGPDHGQERTHAWTVVRGAVAAWQGPCSFCWRSAGGGAGPTSCWRRPTTPTP